MSRHTTKAIRVYSDAIMRVLKFISSLTRPNHTKPCHRYSPSQSNMRHALISVILTCETDEDTREPSECKKADENTSNVSSNLPAAQKEVRKFDGMLGSVRVVMRENKPWFVAKEVAACIEHKDVSTMCKLCRDKDKVVVRANDLTSAELADVKNREYTLISESGLYRILAKCSLPKCESFETWGFDEVLPSIRQTGSYSVTTLALPDFTNPAEAARAGATEYEQSVTAQKALSA